LTFSLECTQYSSEVFFTANSKWRRADYCDIDPIDIHLFYKYHFTLNNMKRMKSINDPRSVHSTEESRIIFLICSEKIFCYGIFYSVTLQFLFFGYVIAWRYTIFSLCYVSITHPWIQFRSSLEPGLGSKSVCDITNNKNHKTSFDILYGRL
jgi:hypothetical protein